jgi:MarR family
MADWSFLTNHARVLVCIANDPGVRLRDIAASLGITERTTHTIVADLTQAGYVVKLKDGRRNRYRIEAHLPLPEPGTREPAIGEVLAVLLGYSDGQYGPADGADALPARLDGLGGLGGHDAPGAAAPDGDSPLGENGRAGAARRS